MSAAGVTAETAQLGLIGLGVMGENLALNIDDHGYRVVHTDWPGVIPPAARGRRQ